jgi:hypothetical protein
MRGRAWAVYFYNLPLEEVRVLRRPTLGGWPAVHMCTRGITEEHNKYEWGALLYLIEILLLFIPTVLA